MIQSDVLGGDPDGEAEVEPASEGSESSDPEAADDDGREATGERGAGEPGADGSLRAEA